MPGLCLETFLFGSHHVLVRVTCQPHFQEMLGDCFVLECFCQCPKLLQSLPVSSFFGTVK